MSEIAPNVGNMVRNVEFLVNFNTGMHLDTLLSAFGTEVAMIGEESDSGIPAVTFLCEIENPKALSESLKALEDSGRAKMSRQAYMGYHYKTYTARILPFPLYVAEIEGYFMLATTDSWFKTYLQTRNVLTAAQVEADPEQPLGQRSLLPVLKAPFGELPEAKTLVGASFSNPGPGIRQLAAMLPLIVPVVNLQLKNYGLSPLPAWIGQAIPPLRPFAEQAFPGVSRTAQESNVVVKETFSSIDPLASPAAAAALVILGRQYLEEHPASRP
ncbi:hypothetical protein HQ520_03785 [bacterium]|nr:hypothetical protein [bacterium]